MGKTVYSKRLKRMAAPSSWPIPRRAHKWVARPVPGPHAIKDCLPLVTVLRDILHVAKSSEEAEHLVSEGLILIDGRPVAEKRFPMGVMDVLGMPKTQEYYRVLPVPGKGLTPHRIDRSEASFKVRRIVGKTTLKRGDTQVNFHDGAAWVVKVADATKPVEDVYRVGDGVRFNLRTREILDHVPLSVGAYVLLTSGRNLGLHGRLDALEKGSLTGEPTATVRVPRGDQIHTTVANLFPVGLEKPLIVLPEASW